MKSKEEKLIIAEIGSVHDGSFGNACKLIKVAASCGADIVKFQTHISGSETLREAPTPSYFQGEPRYEYFDRTAFSPVQWRELSTECENNGVKFLSSPFSIEAVNLLESIGIPFYKVPSGEVSNIPLLEYLAALGKPVFLSTGMSSWKEIDLAVEILINRVELSIMQCTSAYPCPSERVGLNVLQEFQKRYGNSVTIGFSDHTANISAGIAAAILGARVIEKHLTFSKQMYGSDASNALEPEDFKLYCSSIREAWSMIESPVNKNDMTMLNEMKHIFEKSIVAARPIAAGSIITKSDLNYKKPGNGLQPNQYKDLIGRRTNKDVSLDHQFSLNDFE